MSSVSQIESEWKPKANPWFIATAVMIATFIVVLDTTIANVALPQMAGSFSATQDEILWVITTYLIANGVILPATAWFSSIFGRKNFFIICIILFGLASFCCGMSTSLDMIIIARITQGIGGGALLPISQAILFESFPKEKHAQAMSLYGLGVVFAPVIGPALGGWLTDSYSWNWIFFVNVPICLIAVGMAQLFIEDPPYMKAKGMQKIDYFGFATLTLWLVTLQIVLDNGQKSDWFNAPWVCWTSSVSAISMTVLLVWELINKEPLFDLKVFKNWNFTFGTIVNTVIFGLLYACMAILPLFLQSLLGYSALLCGIAGTPQGVGSLISILIAAVIANKIDLRIQVAFGFILLATSCYMFGNLNLSISLINVVLPNAILGAAFGFILVPLTTLTFSTLKQEEMTNASGIQNLLKNISGAVGTSMVGTMIARFSQTHQNMMVENLNPLNPVFQYKVAYVTKALSAYMSPVVAQYKANFVMYGDLIKQSYLWAYMDCYRTYALVGILLFPMVFLIKKVKYDKKQQNVSAMH